jgi:hypothetical protein
LDEKAILAIQRKAVAELLNGPLRRGVVGEIPMHDAACADVEDDKDVPPLKGSRDRDEEVTGENGAGMIAQERGPCLG